MEEARAARSAGAANLKSRTTLDLSPEQNNANPIAKRVAAKNVTDIRACHARTVRDCLIHCLEIEKAGQPPSGGPA